MGKREELLAAVKARVERATTTDMASVLEPRTLIEAQQLTRLLEDEDGDLTPRYLLGWLHWYRYQALPEGEDLPDLDAAIDMFLPCFLLGVPGLPAALEPTLASAATSIANALLTEARRSTDTTLISAAVKLWQRIANATPHDDPDRAGHLLNLAIALHNRFGRSGRLADLDAAIRAAHEAVDTVAHIDPRRPLMLSILGAALRARFMQTGEPADLDAAVKAARDAVEAVPLRHPDRPGRLTNLGIALNFKFEQTGELADLDAAIKAAQEAVEATPVGHPDRPLFIANLGGTLHTRFKRTGTLADLNAVIRAVRDAVEATPVDHPDRVQRLSNLALVLRNRFERFGETADLDDSILAARTAVETTSVDNPERETMLTNLGNALHDRFERTDSLADLNAAIETYHEALKVTPETYPGRAGTLSNLGVALQTRFDRTGKLADLDAAMQASQQAVTATNEDHLEWPERLSNLGTVLHTRFERLGVPADLDAAIQAEQHAIEATPEDHPHRAVYLSNLASALRVRFERTGSLTDLNAAVGAGQQAVDARPADHPAQAGALSNLANALRSRSARTGALEDLERATKALRAAVEAVPTDHPNRAAMWSNLGITMKAQFDRTGQLIDLNAAIEAGNSSVEATPADHPDRAARLTNLANALHDRFEKTGVQGDLDAAIQGVREAIKSTPGNHPNRAAMLSTLGTVAQTRFEHTGNPADLDEASSAFADAAYLSSAAPSLRIKCAQSAASLKAESAPGPAADLLESAVRLLSEVAPRQLSQRDQQHAIGRFAGLASHAAALALANSTSGTTNQQRATRALQLLETGRAVLLSQALDTRDDLTELRLRHPDIAKRFINLRDRLDQPDETSLPIAETDAMSASAPGRQGEMRRQLAEHLSATLAEIRQLDGFTSFGLPPAPDELIAQAESGPIVTFNVSDYRSDALLLTSNGIISIELPGLTAESIIQNISSFHRALDAANHAYRDAENAAAQQTLMRVLGWLWDVAAEPVLEALGYDKTPEPGSTWPRVWWEPGGVLGLLPLHAAGHYSEPSPSGGANRTVLDRVVSSYTPSIRALRYARQHARDATGSEQVLIVAMPNTPDLPGGAVLPNVPAEVAALRSIFPAAVVLTESSIQRNGDDTTIPTRARVLTHISGCSIAHFACHGVSDPSDPAKSRLILHDHEISPLTVTSLATIKHDQLQLVYLSACRTAFTPAVELLDEAIHLTSAFQLAGSRHVIGTLWEISDAVAVDVAAAFYTGLRSSTGTIDTGRAAVALHNAVTTARTRYPHQPSLWAAYLHTGA